MTQIGITKGIRCSRIQGVIQLALTKNYSTQAETEIVIPKRIQRGPTDILRALSSTVNRDYTAPHYKYHDDPYLIPTSNYGKRSFALSQESGKKAAKWILQEHADLFQHKVAEPPIEAFYPKKVYNEDSEVDEASLKKAINDLEVSDAITIYNLLQKKDLTLPRELQQDLLELICFYNANDKLDEEWIEERWFKQGLRDRSRQRKTWKDNETAEAIFKSLDPPDSKSYSAIISGMASHGQLEHSWKYYDEARANGAILSTKVYNTLLRSVGFVKDQHEARWNLIVDLLNEMNTNKVRPDIGTLNSILDTLVGMFSNRNSRLYALRMIAEFRGIGIEPSLATYNYLLKLYCRDKNNTSGILFDIMDALEGKTFTIQDPKDTFFFVSAMDVAANHLSNLALADRVNKLLHTGNNYNLIGDSYKESIYYRHYFLLKCEFESIEDFMKLYEDLVPNIYIPEPTIMEVLLRSVDMNGANYLLPKLWSDMVLFDHSRRENLIVLLLESMYKNPADDEVLQTKMADVAESVWDKIENQKFDRSTKAPIDWTGSMLGHVMAVLLNGKRFEKACEILMKLDKEQQLVLGVPDIRPLQAFVDACIERNDAAKALWCVQYCYDAGFAETQELGQKIHSSLKLLDSELSRLTSIVGPDVIKTASPSSSSSN